MGPNRIIGQSRSLGKPRPILRVARSFDGSSSADAARDSPERKASHSGARRSAATACTRETGPEEHQGDNADYCIQRMNQQTIGQSADIHAMTEFEFAALRVLKKRIAVDLWNREQGERIIAMRAFALFSRRGQWRGLGLDDWLEAERRSLWRKTKLSFRSRTNGSTSRFRQPGPSRDTSY